MEQFMPSKRILEEICNDEKPSVQYTVFPTKLSVDEMEDVLRPFAVGTAYQIAAYYFKEVNIESTEILPRVVPVVWEALKNAIAHGSKNQDPVVMGLFIGSKGVCYGFKDSGDYFKSEEVKKSFESKTILKEFGEYLDGFSGYHLGVNHTIFPRLDLIEVDTEKGILYCVQFKTSLDRKFYK